MNPAPVRRRLPKVLAVFALSVVTLFCEDNCNRDPVQPTPFVTVTPAGPITLLVGGFVQLSATGFPNNGPFLWTSTAPGVATVSSTGRVDALAEGNTLIQASMFNAVPGSVLVEVVGESGAAVILDATLSGAFQAGDTIALSRITHGRPADPDACAFVHLHTAFGESGILIDGAGPFADPNPPVCGFGRIIQL